MTSTPHHLLRLSRRAVGMALMAGLCAGAAVAQDGPGFAAPPVFVTGKIQGADSAKGFPLTVAALQKLPRRASRPMRPGPRRLKPIPVCCCGTC